MSVTGGRDFLPLDFSALWGRACKILQCLKEENLDRLKSKR